MFILGAIIAPLILYGFATYHYNCYFLYPRPELSNLPILPPKSLDDVVQHAPFRDSVAVRLDNRAIYDALAPLYDVPDFGWFNEQMKEPLNRQHVLKMLTSPEFGNQEILQGIRIGESGHRVFFTHIAQSSHYLLLIAPYIICVFCRFTYWSVRTALARGEK